MSNYNYDNILEKCKSCSNSEYEALGKDAADLIMSLQAQLAKFEKRIAAEGFSDLETMISKYKTVMLAANEISIETDEEIECLKARLAERGKGCEYCNPNPYGHGEAIKPLITQVFNDEAHIHTTIRGDGLHTIAYPSPEDTKLAKTYSKCCIIKFCPMCGRKVR